jgi:hypothetical protein
MAKQKKTNRMDIPPVPREAIAAVRGRRIFWRCCGGACAAYSMNPASPIFDDQEPAGLIL